MENAMNVAASACAPNPCPHRPRKFGLSSCFTLLLLLLMSGLGSAQDKRIILPIDPEPDPDPNYVQIVVAQGHGWQLVQTSGVIEDSAQRYTERVFMINGMHGLADVPLPQILKNELINDLAGTPEGETMSFAINQRIADEIALSEAQGGPTDALIALAETDDGNPPLLHDKSYLAKGSCGDRDIVKNKHFSINAPLNSSTSLSGGFTGSVSLTGTANLNADGEIKITLKRAKVWFLCIPYGVKFRHARVWGTALIDQGATLSGTISYSNPQAREWQIAKPHLFSIDFWAGPIPVHIGFNLPITAGFDQGGITGSVTGSATYSGRRSISGYLDYWCTASSCGGFSNFDTTNIGPQPLTGSISGRFQPSIYAQVAVRGYLYSEGVAYAQVGVRPYLRGDLWGYYGNNCGDADGDGFFETVDALTFDLDWQLYVTAQANTFLTSEWRHNIWSSPRWHIAFWDLLGGDGSSALTPMLAGPAVVPANTAQTYGARMRACWPYTDNVDYTLNWGDGGTQALNGPAATLTNASHSWANIGTPQLSLLALRDAHGRQLNKTTWRPVQVSAVQGHMGMTWKLLGSDGSYAHVGGDAQTSPYNGDTSPTVSLPLLCLNQDGRSAPFWMTFDFYNGWAAGEVRLSAPVQGLALTSRAVADGICLSTFGLGYRMGEFHDGGGGWSWWGQGVLSPNTRFWVAIDDQPANPWN
jgi:hypothetical protein